MYLPESRLSHGTTEQCNRDHTNNKGAIKGEITIFFSQFVTGRRVVLQLVFLEAYNGDLVLIPLKGVPIKQNT